MKGGKAKSAKEKVSSGKVWKKSGASFQESSPSIVAEAAFSYTSNGLWQYRQVLSSRKTCLSLII